MEKGGREECVLTDESEPAMGKAGLRITPSPAQPGGHSTAPLPPAKCRSQPLGGEGEGPHLINPLALVLTGLAGTGGVVNLRRR